MAAPQPEVVSVANFNARIRGLGAVFMQDRSSAQAHIFYIGATRRWVKAVRHPQDPARYVVLTYHKDCPCSGG